MLTKLLADAQKIAGDLPTLQAAVAAIQADLADPAAVNLAKLATDAAALDEISGTVAMDVESLTADIGELPATKGGE